MPGVDGEFRPGAYRRARVQRRLDPAHGRRAVHPGWGDHPAAARQHRTARRRNLRAARACQHPGLDRHPTLFNLLPGYLPMPDTSHTGLASYLDSLSGDKQKGFWRDADPFMISLLKEYWGHGTYRTVMDMVDGTEGAGVVGRQPRRVDRSRHPGLREGQATGLPAARGSGGAGGAARRRPVHHAGRREGVAVRAGRARRRPTAHPLRAGRVAGPQPAVRAAGQPGAQDLRAPGQPVQPVLARSAP